MFLHALAFHLVYPQSFYLPQNTSRTIFRLYSYLYFTEFSEKSSIYEQQIISFSLIDV